MLKLLPNNTMSQQEQTSSLTPTDEQQKNARRIMQKLLKGTFDISTPIEDLPDIGPWRDILIKGFIEPYKEDGKSIIPDLLQVHRLDYPAIESLARKNKYARLTPEELDALPDQDWLIPNFLYEDAISVVYGPSGLGKSFLTLDWAFCLALGRHWQGRKVKQCRVTYLAAEGERGYKRRQRAWCKHNNATPQELTPYMAYIPLAVPLQNPAEVSELIEEIIDQQEEYNDHLPSVFFLDTILACSAGQNTNGSDVMSALVSAAQRIRREANVSHVVLVHHTGKDKDRGMLGSVALKASTDLSYFVDGNKEDGLITLTSDKVKDDEDVTIYLQRQRVVYGDGPRDHSCVIIAGEKPQKEKTFSANQQILIDSLTSHPTGLKLTPLLNATAEQTGEAMKKQTALDNLRILQEKKVITKSRDGLYCISQEYLARSGDNAA